MTKRKQQEALAEPSRPPAYRWLKPADACREFGFESPEQLLRWLQKHNAAKATPENVRVARIKGLGVDALSLRRALDWRAERDSQPRPRADNAFMARAVLRAQGRL